MLLFSIVVVALYLSLIAFYLLRFHQHEKGMQQFADVMQEGLEVYADKVDKLQRENPEWHAKRQEAARNWNKI